MNIKVIKFQSGERYPFLLDQMGVPDFWVTHFVTQNLRLSHTCNGMEFYLRSILHLKKWEEINGRNLVDEIYLGQIPNLTDISSIKSHCALQAGQINSAKNKKIRDLNILSLPPKNKRTVTNNQQRVRFSHIKEYLHWVGIERVKHKADASYLFDRLNEMRENFENNKPKGGKRSSADKSDISSEAFEDFVKIAQLDSVFNPFKSSIIKFRNYLIIQILYQTGMRVSELIALQIADIGTDIDIPTLMIKRRHNNPDDPRINEPTAKTLGRELEITPSLRELLNKYIYEYRSKTSFSKKHPFIFVSHKKKAGNYESGQPITRKTVTKILTAICKINLEQFQGISPHQFRHYFNERLSDVIDLKKQEIDKEIERLESEGKYESAKRYRNEYEINEKRELEIRANLNGHSSLESGHSYLKRSIKKQSSVLRNEMHQLLKRKMEKKYHG